MKRVTFLGLLLASSGCALHVETSRNLPAPLSTPLETPPSELWQRGVSDHGEDRGMRGWLGHLAFIEGEVIDSKGDGGAVGIEIGATPFELDKWHTDAPFEAQPRTWFRPSLGWMFLDQSNTRITKGRPGSGIGPLYGELQFFPWQAKGGFGALQVGIGGQVELAYEDAGVQSTICMGPHLLLLMVCVRGAYLANRGPELGIFADVNGLMTLGWAK
jgi:hypothetical protein